MNDRKMLMDVLRDIQGKLPQVYDMEELRTIAWNLGVDWEDLLGSTEEAKCYSLLFHMAITGELEVFHRELIHTRPAWDWPALPKDFKQVAKTTSAEEPASPPVGHEFDIGKFRRQIVQYFDLGELKDLCFDLGIEYDDLADGRLSDKARELLRYARRHNRLDDVIAYCKKARKAVLWGV